VADVDYLMRRKFEQIHSVCAVPIKTAFLLEDYGMENPERGERDDYPWTCLERQDRTDGADLGSHVSPPHLHLSQLASLC